MEKLSCLKIGSLVIPKVGEYKDKFIVVLDTDGNSPNVKAIVGVSPDGHRVVHEIKDIRYPTDKELEVYKYIAKVFGYSASLVDLHSSEYDGLFISSMHNVKRTIDKSLIEILYKGGILYTGEAFSFTGKTVDGTTYYLKIKAISQYNSYCRLNGL